MKKIGAILIKVLYPLLYLFVIWLFLFSEETNNIIHLIAVFVAFGLFITFAPYVYGISEKRIGERLFKIGTMISTVFFFFPFVVASGYLLVIAYDKLKIMVLTTSLLLVLLLVFYIITVSTLKSIASERKVKDEIAKRIAVCRIITLSLWLVSSICLIVITVGLLINSVVVISDSDSIHVFGKWFVSSDLVVSSGIILWFFSAVFSFRKIYSDFHFIVFDKENYVLFLRSFSFDEKERKEHVLDFVLKKFGLPILKIGNPKSFFPKGIGESFYLPTTDWKKQLDYYIKKAKYVFSVVDVTEGVFWEMFRHLDMMEKFVYYISDKKTLFSFVKMHESREFSKTSLMYCFKTILEDETIEKVAFCIRDNCCYYSDADNIVQWIVQGEKNVGIRSFSVNLQDFEMPEPDSEENLAGPEYSANIDKLRKNSRGFNGLFKKSLSITGMILSWVFVIFSTIFSLSLIVTGFIFIFYPVIISDNIDENLRVPEGIFAILFGGWLLYKVLLEDIIKKKK